MSSGKFYSELIRLQLHRIIKGIEIIIGIEPVMQLHDDIILPYPFRPCGYIEIHVISASWIKPVISIEPFKINPNIN